MAILSGKDGLKALQRDKSPTPLQLLIKEMPGETLPQYCLACTPSVAIHYWNLC